MNGQLHPRWERGPLFFQQKNREVIFEFRGREVREGREIWGAAVDGARGGKVGA